VIILKPLKMTNVKIPHPMTKTRQRWLTSFKFNADKVAYWKSPEGIIAIENRDAKRLLRRQGFTLEQLTPELIELKRITLKTERLCRRLKNS